MQLNELLEEQSVKSISNKTMISVDDITSLISGDFDRLKRTKALGFISIFEREYKVDMSELKNNAEDFYADNKEENIYSVELPCPEDNKAKRKFIYLWLLPVIGLVYYFTQVNTEVLDKYIPSVINIFETEEKPENNVTSSSKVEVISENIEKENMEEENIVEPMTEKTEKESNLLYGVEVDNDTLEKEAQKKSEEAEEKALEEEKADETVVNESITIIPKKRLWFGIVNAKTKKRKHYTVSEPFVLELQDEVWLISTSIASFTLRDVEGDQPYTNGKSNYFKVDKNETIKLSKKEYVALGGYRKW